MEEKEVWENAGAGDLYIDTYFKGDVRSVRVPPKGRVSVSIEEREANQLKVVNEGMDFFSNGDLVPIRLIESAEDYEEISSNPNLLADSELSNLLDLKVGEFQEKVEEISNLSILDRLDSLVEEHGSVAKGKVAALKARREELDPKPEAMYSPIEDTEGESVE